jgi:hypothetical protein
LLLAVGCLQGASAAMASSTLLSGYGSPGEGNQAIIGSALIGGGGSGGSTGSGAGSLEAPEGARTQAPQEAHAGSPSHATGQSSSPSGGATGSQSDGRSRLGGSGGAPRGGGAAAVSVHATTEPLGVTGSDLLYMILALMVLTGVGVATALLVRDQRRSPNS